MTYLLRLSLEHARAVSAACDLYGRIAMGQTKEIGAVFEGKNGEWQRQRDNGMDEILEALKKILFPDLDRNQYYGIMNSKTGRPAHLCYEVQKEVDYRIAWTEHPKKADEFGGNDYYKPVLFPSGVQPRPQCASEDGTQPELAASGQRIAREIEKELGTTDIKEALRIIRELKQIKEAVCQGSASGAVKKSRSTKEKQTATSRSESTATKSARPKTARSKSAKGK